MFVILFNIGKLKSMHLIQAASCMNNNIRCLLMILLSSSPSVCIVYKVNNGNDIKAKHHYIHFYKCILSVGTLNFTRFFIKQFAFIISSISNLNQEYDSLNIIQWTFKTGCNFFNYDTSNFMAWHESFNCLNYHLSRV